MFAGDDLLGYAEDHEWCLWEWDGRVWAGKPRKLPAKCGVRRVKPI
jgi:hypothetical protein